MRGVLILWADSNHGTLVSYLVGMVGSNGEKEPSLNSILKNWWMQWNWWKVHRVTGMIVDKAIVCTTLESDNNWKFIDTALRFVLLHTAGLSWTSRGRCVFLLSRLTAKMCECKGLIVCSLAILLQRGAQLLVFNFINEYKLCLPPLKRSLVLLMCHLSCMVYICRLTLKGHYQIIGTNICV